MKLFTLAYILCSTLLIQSQSQELQLSKIDSIINSKVLQEDPGIAVGIIKNGEIIYENYRGLSNLQHKVDFNKHTRSNIASTAKQFTALMILDLSLKGKIDLEDDIRAYLPDLYKGLEDNIRVRHVLNHTSGIRDYVELLDLEGNVWWQRFGLDNTDVLELLEKQNSLGFKPGSLYDYSNSNYIVLTKIIEKVTEQSFNDYSKAFFESLGMKETSFVEKYMAVIPNRANPYSDWGNGEWSEVPTVTKTNGEGFLFTTLKDQLIYEQKLQNAIADNKVLLIKSQMPIPNSEIKTYGFGLELKNQLGRTSVYHSGGTYGFNAQADRYPEEGLSIFIMSNHGNISSYVIAKDIARILLPKIETKEAYDTNLTSRKTDESVTVIGQYNYPNADKLVRIVESEGKLFWKEGNYFNLELINEDLNTYRFQNNPKLKVVFYDKELVEYYASGKTMVYARNENRSATYEDLQSFIGDYYNDELDISFNLKLNNEDELRFKFSNENEDKDIQVFNNNQLLAGNNYKLKIQKDSFNRVSGILLSYGRAKNMLFTKTTNLNFQPKIKTENGSIQVTTIGSKNGDSSDILLTKNYENGNEIWFKQFGGKSYDKASSIIETKDGYLIVGSTSSYGKGNYDMFVIKTDKEGKKLWQNTYGGFYNEYGYTAECTPEGFIIKGTIQKCPNNTDINRKCTTNVWFVEVDKKGKELSNKVLQLIKS